MKRIAKCLILNVACVWVLTSGCRTATTETNTFDYNQQNVDPRSHSGLSLSEAQNRALKLQLAMSQDAVKQLLGDPDETSTERAGTTTGHPWQAIVWNYKWDAPYIHRDLQILFEQGPNSWLVNSWNWY